MVQRHAKVWSSHLGEMKGFFTESSSVFERVLLATRSTMSVHELMEKNVEKEALHQNHLEGADRLGITNMYCPGEGRSSPILCVFSVPRRSYSHLLVPHSAYVRVSR